MKINNLIKTIIASVVISASPFAFSATATGKVTTIQVPTNTDVKTIYFKIDPMPQSVNWLYIRHGSGTDAGCTLAGDEKTTDRAYSALLTAKASGQEILVSYCVNSNSYGLVNGSLTIDP